MAKYAITPWRSQHDLLQVRSQLYHTDTSTSTSTVESRRHAVDRIMAWKLRGNLPHAVESTALLIDATLHHSNPSNSIFSVRAVYSAAFTRFVTGFCDIGRSKERSLEPSSMLDIAKQIGMPVEFVALRHEATHEELPAIQRLVKATDDALGWLWTVYWSRLEEPETEEAVIASLGQLRADARVLLRNFRGKRREAVKAKKHRSEPEEVSSTARASVELFGSNAMKMEAFVGVLIQDKLLSPSKRELGSSLDGAYLIWDDLLRSIVQAQKRFATILVKTLLEAMSSPSTSRPDQDSEKEAMHMWLTHVLLSKGWRASLSPEHGYNLQKEAMTWCCMHPGNWTRTLSGKILEDQDSEFVDEWKDVFEASQLQDEVVVAQDGDVKMSEPEHLEDDILRHRAEDDSGLGNWVRAPKPFAVPIGVVR